MSRGDGGGSLATNGSNWQLSGNILAADWLLTGSIWQRAGPQWAAKWQRNGNKWQQGMQRIWGHAPRRGRFRDLQADMAIGR
jgi:hypothetical protein